MKTQSDPHTAGDLKETNFQGNDKLGKKEAFSPTERLKTKDKPIALPKGFKVHRYPIF